MFGSGGYFENGSFAASARISRALQIMMSHLKGSSRAKAARRADSLTSLRTMNVPTAPMFTTSNFASFLAMAAGWQRFALPTLTARRNTTDGIEQSKEEELRIRK